MSYLRGNIAFIYVLIDINNVGSISQALYAHEQSDYDEVKAGAWQAAQVSTISLTNFFGRIAIGQSLLEPFNLITTEPHSRSNGRFDQGFFPRAAFLLYDDRGERFSRFPANGSHRSRCSTFMGGKCLAWAVLWWFIWPHAHHCYRVLWSTSDFFYSAAYSSLISTINSAL